MKYLHHYLPGDGEGNVPLNILQSDLAQQKLTKVLLYIVLQFKLL